MTQYLSFCFLSTSSSSIHPGTVTVEVEVEDVNDEPPRFPREEWRVEVEEELPPLSLLASLSVLDPDVTNDFAFRVSGTSGVGREWSRVVLRGVKVQWSGTVGHRI